MSSIRPSVLKVGLLVALAAVAAFPVEAQGPPQGQVVIDMVRLNFMPNQGYKEIPADGVAGMGAMTSIYWSIQGGSPPSPLGTTVSWTVLAGGGEFDPPSKSVVFTSNPHGEPVAYKQPTTPSATDVTVHGCASAGNKMGEDSLVLRGISMLIERRGPEELYSGTSTLRATTTVYAIAVCPGNLSLRPSGKVYATVSGDGVYLKWDEGGATVYGKSRAVDVTWMSIPDMPPSEPLMMAQFVVAADKPGALPTSPVNAVFSASFGTANSPVTAQATVPVLVPLKLEHPASVGERAIVKQGEEFGGHLVWYADHGGSKYYWGAKGSVRWSLPQGQTEVPYLQPNYGDPVPVGYYSMETTAAGNGTRTLNEEHGWSTTVDVGIKEHPRNWLQEFLTSWQGWYTNVIEGDLNEAFVTFLATKVF